MTLPAEMPRFLEDYPNPLSAVAGLIVQRSLIKAGLRFGRERIETAGIAGVSSGLAGVI